MNGFWVLLHTLAVLSLVVDGRRKRIYEFETDDQSQEQRGEPGVAVKGSYSWASPEGIEFRVKYVADEFGYRILSSNAIPVNGQGIAADGNQGSFEPLQEEDGERERGERVEEGNGGEKSKMKKNQRRKKKMGKGKAN